MIKEKFNLSEFLAEEISKWDDLKIVDAFKSKWDKENPTELDEVWVLNLVNEMEFRLSFSDLKKERKQVSLPSLLQV